MKILFTILLSLTSIFVFAQSELKQIKHIEKTLINLADTIRLSKDLEYRETASDTFLQKFTELLATVPNSFEYGFDSLTTVSKVYPPDSTFRVMTWQLYIDKNQYKYFGILQKNNGTASEVIELKDFSRRMRKPDYSELTANNWYGALYYGIHPFKTKEGMKYVLFGYDAYEFFEKRKIMDILSFDEDGAPVFGEGPLIEYTRKRKNAPPETLRFNRFVMQYASNVTVSIKYEEDKKMIVFDNLIAVQSTFPGVPIILVPDGSYDGFKWEKGKWRHVSKIYNQVSETAPRPEPVFGNKKRKKRRDLFGRER